MKVGCSPTALPQVGQREAEVSERLVEISDQVGIEKSQLLEFSILPEPFKHILVWAERWAYVLTAHE